MLARVGRRAFATVRGSRKGREGIGTRKGRIGTRKRGIRDEGGRHRGKGGIGTYRDEESVEEETIGTKG